MDQLDFEIVEKLDPEPERIVEGVAGRGDDMKFLEVEVPGSVFATIDQIEDHTGQGDALVRPVPLAQIAKQGAVGDRTGGFEAGDRDRQDRVRTEFCFVPGAVEGNQGIV